MRQCCECIRGLPFKLRMLGVPVNDPVIIYGDNQSVLWNTKVPESTLKKKSSVVAYHYCREGVSRKEWVPNYVNESDNPSDIMTNSISNSQDRKRKIRMIFLILVLKNNMNKNGEKTWRKDMNKNGEKT